MARAARHKSTEAAFYHLTNRVAGRTDWFPFKNDQARRKLLDMMLFYVNAYPVSFGRVPDHGQSLPLRRPF